MKKALTTELFKAPSAAGVSKIFFRLGALGAGVARKIFLVWDAVPLKIPENFFWGMALSNSEKFFWVL